MWLIGIFVGTELWYRSHERELIAVAERGSSRWPADNATLPRDADRRHYPRDPALR